MPDFLKLGVKLMLIAGGSAALLALVNEQTKERIECAEKEEVTKALCEVLPQAGTGTIKPIRKNGEIKYYVVYKTPAEREITGYAFIAEKRGYSSLIQVAIGVDPQVKITGVKILKQKETPGLGARIEEEDFLKQFKGLGMEGLNEVDTITGATISSQAVIKAITGKLKQLIKSQRPLQNESIP